MAMEPHDLDGVEEQEQMIRAGAAFEAAGLMAQADYVRLARLSKEVVGNGGCISDADLDWALALLGSAPEAAARSRVMVMLAVLGHGTPLPPAQKERIVAAVTPYADSENKLDRLSAAHALHAPLPGSVGRGQPPSEN
jgi:hypothetical protein